jgi:hypothetical protein
LSITGINKTSSKLVITPWIYVDEGSD